MFPILYVGLAVLNILLALMYFVEGSVWIAGIWTLCAALNSFNAFLQWKYDV